MIRFIRLSGHRVCAQDRLGCVPVYHMYMYVYIYIYYCKCRGFCTHCEYITLRDRFIIKIITISILFLGQPRPNFEGDKLISVNEQSMCEGKTRVMNKRRDAKRPQIPVRTIYRVAKIIRQKAVTVNDFARSASNHGILSIWYESDDQRLLLEKRFRMKFY